MGWELLLVCNIFPFRIFGHEAIILTIYHCILIIFTFNIHTEKNSTKKSALMVIVFLVMLSWMTIIVDFALTYLNTRDLCSCLHSGGFFYPYLTFFLICYWSHDIFPDCPETSPFPGLLPCSLENFFVILHKLQCFSCWCLSLCHFTLA